jgi:hypothetical protein
MPSSAGKPLYTILAKEKRSDPGHMTSGHFLVDAIAVYTT